MLARSSFSEHLVPDDESQSIKGTNLTAVSLVASSTSSPWGRPQVLNDICRNLSVTDLYTFAQVSQQFKNAAYREEIWEWRMKLLGISPSNEDSGENSNDVGQGTLQEGTNLSPLNALDGFKYTKGNARTSYMSLWRIFYPLYIDLVRSGRHAEPLIFRAYRDPLEQAMALRQIQKFAESDPLEHGYDEKRSTLASTVEFFENAALVEFETGLDEKDILGKVKEYASVLITLNGGDSCIQLYTQKHPLIYDKERADGSEFLKPNGKLDGTKFQTHF
jgi:recyclin-1